MAAEHVAARVSIAADDLRRGPRRDVALHEYAEDWADHLRHASNHEQNRGPIQIIDQSSDEQLRDWLQR